MLLEITIDGPVLEGQPAQVAQTLQDFSNRLEHRLDPLIFQLLLQQLVE